MHTPARDQTYKPGMCSDPESNWKPFTYRMMPYQQSHTGQSILCFLNGIVWVFAAEVYEFFICFGTNPLLEVLFTNIFSNLVAWHFALLIVSCFAETWIERINIV